MRPANQFCSSACTRSTTDLRLTPQVNVRVAPGDFADNTLQLAHDLAIEGCGAVMGVCGRAMQVDHETRYGLGDEIRLCHAGESISVGWTEGTPRRVG
jgi:hypothetical protein